MENKNITNIDDNEYNEDNDNNWNDILQQLTKKEEKKVVNIDKDTITKEYWIYLEQYYTKLLITSTDTTINYVVKFLIKNKMIVSLNNLLKNKCSNNILIKIIKKLRRKKLLVNDLLHDEMNPCRLGILKYLLKKKIVNMSVTDILICIKNVFDVIGLININLTDRTNTDIINIINELHSQCINHIICSNSFGVNDVKLVKWILKVIKHINKNQETTVTLFKHIDVRHVTLKYDYELAQLIIGQIHHYALCIRNYEIINIIKC